MRVSVILALALTSMVPMMMAKEDADQRLNSAADVLGDMMRASDKGIPQDLLNKAQCVVIVPGMKKGAFIVGAKYGKGFAVCRRTSGMGWSAPAAIRVEGGSVGFQIGGSEQDVILLVMNHSGMNRLLKDQFTVGGEGTVAAGPLGRDAEAQTDAMMRAEMLSYSRSRGVFAGISLQGATMRQDDDADAELYGHKITNREILAGDVHAPASAAALESALDKNSMHRSH
ncbi:MAG TPA: lipid-binding SYLF domain-containing protein [Bryobacteraceae bacterium]|jgi:lipid-binding SYLF domain-containing protein